MLNNFTHRNLIDTEHKLSNLKFDVNIEAPCVTKPILQECLQSRIKTTLKVPAGSIRYYVTDYYLLCVIIRISTWKFTGHSCSEHRPDEGVPVRAARDEMGAIIRES